MAGCTGLFGSYCLWRAATSWEWSLVPIAAIFFAVSFHVSNSGRLEGRWRGRHSIPYKGSVRLPVQKVSLPRNGDQLAVTHPRNSLDRLSSFEEVKHFPMRPLCARCDRAAKRHATGRTGYDSLRRQPGSEAGLLHRTDWHATWLTREGQLFVITAQL